jgi:hypothetical protein
VRSFCSWDVLLMPLLCPLQCTSQSPFFLARFGCMVVLILLLLQCSDAAAQCLWYPICCLSVCDLWSYTPDQATISWRMGMKGGLPIALCH